MPARTSLRAVAGTTALFAGTRLLRTMLAQFLHRLRQFVLRKLAILVRVVFSHQMCRQLCRALLLLSALGAALSTAGSASAGVLGQGVEG